MSYNCKVCGEHVGSGTPLKKHVVYRKNSKEIAAEIPVCDRCDELLWTGTPLSELARYFNQPVKSLAAVGASVTPGRDDRRRPTPQQPPAPTKPNPRRPRCDVCGEEVIDGQVTPESVLCSKHIVKSRGKGRKR